MALFRTLSFAFLAINAVGASSCDESVISIVLKTTSDAYVDIHTQNGKNLEKFGTKNGLFLQNEGK